MPYIRIETGPDKGVVRPVESKYISIGRSSENDMVLNDETVSSHHAAIAYINRTYFIEDQDSANGVYVNKIKVQRKRLFDKDEILLGKTRLLYVESVEGGDAETGEVPISRRSSNEILGAFTSETPSPENMDALRQAHENLRRVYEINRVISSIFDVSELCDKILDIIFPLFDADRGYILLVDKDDDELKLVTDKRSEENLEDSSQVAFSRTIARRVLENEESIITSNAPEDSRFTRKASILEGQIMSAMCVPIKGREEKLGVIYVDHRGAARHFSDDQLQLLTMVASFTGIAIENIHLYEESLKINVLKAVNEEMHETNRKLRELESLKNDLINMVVHDMKNPVSNTMMGLDMVELDAENQVTDQQREYLRLAKRNQFKLSEMITNLLEISQLESGAIQISKSGVDAEELIRSAVERYRVTMEADEKRVEALVAPEVKWIVTDGRLLDRILCNLLSNAIKHSYPQGEIIIRIDPVKEKNGIRLSVQDFGEGIPKEYHEEIFEKFCRAGLRELGHKTDTGLGLAFCKMAIGALGGIINVESEPEKGSLFTVSLPNALQNN